MKGGHNGGRASGALSGCCAIRVDCNTVPARIARSVRFSCLETGGAVPAARHGGSDAAVRAGSRVAAQRSSAGMLCVGTYAKAGGLAVDTARLAAQAWPGLPTWQIKLCRSWPGDLLPEGLLLLEAVAPGGLVTPFTPSRTQRGCELSLLMFSM